MTDTPTRILVTGAGGQIGSELVTALRGVYSPTSVIASDLEQIRHQRLANVTPFEVVDVTNYKQLLTALNDYKVSVVYHMAAILSATGENYPQLAWEVNLDGLRNVLEAARESSVQKIFIPSSIAVFGPETPQNPAPQEAVLRPRTIYGITKLTGELLANYYHDRYGLDTRGIRYPGIVSHKTKPGGGTTDYAVEIFRKAIWNEHYVCFLKSSTRLPMMYMPDCIDATIKLMTADASGLKHRCDFNVTGMSFSPQELAVEIKKYIPEFTWEFQPDFRQDIAESWPQSIDDSVAHEEWGWRPQYNLESMTLDMIAKLRATQQPSF